MRRPFVSVMFAVALALPAASFAQATATQQPPAQQPPAQEPAAPPAPKVAFKANAGILLVQVKGDQTTVFEEMIAKLKSGLAATADAALKEQAAGFKVYKASEPAAGGNVLYVVVVDPALPNAEYSFLEVINKTLSPEQQRDPATQEMYKRFAAAFAGMNILNLTPVGG